MPAAYDNLETVVNAARVRLNDAISGIEGDILSDIQPYTIVCVNVGWRKMQEFLSKLGFQKFTGQTVLSALAASSSVDPAVQSRIDWAGHSNGGSVQPGIVLPSDFIAPISLDERISGSFLEMDNLSEKGLPMAPKQAWNKAWEWRGDAIYLPGALQITDIRLRYWSFAPDFVAPSTTAFSAQLVPILRCSDAFSCYVAAEAARARGDMDGKQFTADGEAAATLLVQRENPSVAAPVVQGGL